MWKFTRFWKFNGSGWEWVAVGTSTVGRWKKVEVDGSRWKYIKVIGSLVEAGRSFHRAWP